MSVLRPGRSLGPFRLIERISSGATSELWRARREADEAELALKLLQPRWLEHPEVIEAFEAQGALVASLAHPNIVRILGWGEADGWPYRALELLEGPDLADVGALSLARALDLARDLLRALAHVHSRGLVHGDVSPHNVVVTPTGAKLIDFDFARPENAVGGMSGYGTAAYAAPEQLGRGPVDARADVFAAAVVVFELVTGRRLFKRETEAATLLAVADAPIPRASSLRADLPPELDAVLAHALEREPARRLASAAAFLAMLEPLHG